MPLSFGFGKSQIVSKGQVTGFSPPSSSNLVLWYDAAVAGGSKDSSGVVISTDSTAVQTIVNQKSGGVNATQTNSSQQPLWRSAANGINGKPAWQFDGAGDVIRTASGISLASFTIFCVFKISSGYLLYEHQTDDYLNMSNYYTISAKRSVNGVAVTSGRNNTGNWGNTNVAKYTTHLFDGTHASHILRINGADANLATATGGNPGGATITNTWHLGGRGSGGTVGVAGLVGEVLVYSSLLSNTDIGTVETYLKDKWGL